MVQITHNLNGTCMAHACAKAKTHVASTMHVYVCKIHAPHTRTYPYEVSATKQSSLQSVVP